MICALPMLLVPTLREGTTAHVILDTLEMDSHAIVRFTIDIIITGSDFPIIL